MTGVEPDTSPAVLAHRVREARRSDAPRVRALQTLLSEPSPRLLTYGLGPGTLLVTPDDGDNPVGYLLAVSGPETHVAELVVAPAHRREGRASALLDALFAILPTGHRVTLAVRPDNEGALSLYESVGFERVGREDGFYTDGPALVLARRV
mgnify:CR=1 FL=1